MYPSKSLSDGTKVVSWLFSIFTRRQPAHAHIPSSEARLKVESVPLWCALWYAAPLSRGQSLVGHDEA